MPMLSIPLLRSKPVAPGQTPASLALASADYGEIAAQMLSLRADIAAARREVEALGPLLSQIAPAIERQPSAILLHLEVEAARLSSQFARTALRRVREEVLAEAGRHIWKAAIGAGFTYLVIQWHYILGMFSK